MPTATRRQAHTRSRNSNQRMEESMVEVSADQTPSQSIGSNMPIDQEMEDEDLGGDEEEDEGEEEGLS